MAKNIYDGEEPGGSKVPEKKDFFERVKERPTDSAILIFAGLLLGIILVSIGQ